MTTINLRDGLEALYYFGEQDFKPQRNQLQDHSGYGRHATANGSVTVGNEGLNDFESASFNGGYFTVPSAFIDITGDFSLWMAFKGLSANSGERVHIISSDDVDLDAVEFLLDGNDNLQFEVGDSDGNTVKAISVGPYRDDTWRVLHGVRRGDTISIHVDGEVVAENTDSNLGNTVSNNNASIGQKPIGDAKFGGELAFAGLHYRPLSHVEMRYMSRLTAPRRAQL